MLTKCGVDAFFAHAEFVEMGLRLTLTADAPIATNMPTALALQRLSASERRIAYDT